MATGKKLVFAKKIDALFLKNGWKVHQLAPEVSPSTIQKIRNTNYLPSERTLGKMVTAMKREGGIVELAALLKLYRQQKTALASAPKKAAASNEWEEYLRITPEVQNALGSYLTKYNDTYGQIKLLGMSEPMLLKEVYTDAQMIDSRFRWKWKSVDGMEKAHRQSSSRDFLPKDASTKSGYELANNIQYLNILGQPGGGKSTFLRRIGLDALLPAAEKKYHHDSIPVYVELKRLKDQHVHLLEIIKKELASFNFPPDFAQVALTNGKLLVLLDGLDEVPGNNLDYAIEEIRLFINDNSANRFITSCRTALYQTWFTRFKDVELAEFNNSQIKTFLQNWFRSDLDRERDSAGKFWGMLARPENIATLELARRPLLLAFICLFCDESLSVPANRTDLYEEALRILLVRWAAEKRIRKDPVWRGLTTKWEVNLLEQIAGRALNNGKVFFYKKDLVNEIERVLHNDLNAPHLDGADVLQEIEVQQGLFIARTQNIYSFSHMTIQEYLAAKYFYNNGATKELVEKHFFDSRWREVLLLLVGIGQADNALRLMANAITVNAKTNKLIRSLLTWFTNNNNPTRRDDDSDERLVARRVIGIFIVRAIDDTWNPTFGDGSHLDKILNFAFDLDSRLNLRGGYLPDIYSLARARNSIRLASVLNVIKRIREQEIFKDKILIAAENSINLHKHELDSNSLISMGGNDVMIVDAVRAKKTILEAFEIPEELSGWKRTETLALERYLYGCELLFECRKAALSVSSEVWKDIVNNLFHVQNSQK